MPQPAIRACCFWAIVCAAAWGRAADAPWLVAADGPPVRGTFAGAEGGTLRFDVDGSQRALAADDLAFWGAFVEPVRGMSILLADGSLLVTDQARLEDERVAGTSAVFDKFRLPIELVAAVVFRAPLDAQARDNLLARIAADGRNDRVLLDNGDELSGTIVALDAERLALKTESGPLDIKLDSLAAMVFDPSLVDKPRAGGRRVAVGFDDGSRLLALDIADDGRQTSLGIAGGIKLNAATTAIVALQVFGGRAQYLSDLEPAAYRHIPFLSLAWDYQRDRNVRGGQLRAGGRLSLKGLGMHSPSRLTYDLDRQYRRFQAQVAVDDDTQGRGSVIFRVFLDDGDGAWRAAAESEVLRGGQPPQPLSVDLEGAKRISLLVDYADRGDELDHADWLDARLLR